MGNINKITQYISNYTYMRRYESWEIYIKYITQYISNYTYMRRYESWEI